MKLFSADNLVKLSICLVATHHRARQIATPQRAPTGREQDSQLAKETALAAVTVFFRTLCQVAMWELEHQDTPNAPHASVYRGDGSSTDRGQTYNSDDEANTDGLALQLSSTIRRMLPTLRILFKWLKGNVGILRRHTDKSRMGDVAGLWSKYTALVIKIAEVLPIYHLPSMMGSLEEDIEIRGFMPLAKTTTHAEPFEAKNSSEEHLMRVSDLSIDAVLIVQQAVSISSYRS